MGGVGGWAGALVACGHGLQQRRQVRQAQKLQLWPQRQRQQERSGSGSRRSSGSRSSNAREQKPQLQQPQRPQRQKGVLVSAALRTGP